MTGAVASPDNVVRGDSTCSRDARQDGRVDLPGFLRPISEGEKRLRIELYSSTEEQICQVVERYTGLVDSVTDRVILEAGREARDPQRFIRACSHALKQAGISFGILSDHSLTTSLQISNFNCNTSSFLVLDVARKLGLETKLVLVPGHALLRIGDLYYDVTYGCARDEKSFRERYPRASESGEAHFFEAFSLFVRGSFLKKTGHVDKSMQDLSEAIVLNPEYMEAYCYRAEIFLKQGRWHEALADYTKASLLMPENLYAHRGRASALEGMGQDEEAVEAYSQALRLKQEPNALYRRGLLLAKLGRQEEALADLTGACELFSSDACHNQGTLQPALAAFSRGNVFGKMGRLKEAIADYSMAASLRPDHADTYMFRGYMYEKLGRTQEALLDYTRAVGLNPSDSARIWLEKRLVRSTGDTPSESAEARP